MKQSMIQLQILIMCKDIDIESMLMREMNIKDKEAVVALAKLGVATLKQ